MCRAESSKCGSHVTQGGDSDAHGLLQVESAESKYRAKLDESLEDGIIDADEFGQLESLRKELGISSAPFSLSWEFFCSKFIETCLDIFNFD